MDRKSLDAVGRQRKTGWKLLKNICEGLLEKRSQMKLSEKPLSSEVNGSRGSVVLKKENQEIIVGIIQRVPRRVYAESIPNVKERTLWLIIKNTI